MTKISTVLGIKHNLIQAPMAGVQDAVLAAAVSNFGCLGSIPAAMLSLPQLQEQLTQLKRLTSNPYNVNFFTHTASEPNPQKETAWRTALTPYYAQYDIDPDTQTPSAQRQAFSHDAADVIEPFKPAVISFHFGLPATDLLHRVKTWGSFIIGCATTVKEAQYLEHHGVHAIIAQGLEAGGHRGTFLTNNLSAAMTEQMGTFALLPHIVRHVKLPVIAAGGIVDAPTVQAANLLGAAGVQVGTAFLLCTQATTSKIHRQALESEYANVTALTNLFTGRPARGIVNKLMQDLGPMSAIAPDFPRAGAALVPLKAAAEAKGNGDFSALWAGQNVSACENIPAERIIQKMLCLN